MFEGQLTLNILPASFCRDAFVQPGSETMVRVDGKRIETRKKNVLVTEKKLPKVKMYLSMEKLSYTYTL